MPRKRHKPEEIVAKLRPRQRLRAKWWLATAGALVFSILAFVLFRLW